MVTRRKTMKKKILITALAFSAMALGVGTSAVLSKATTQLNAVNEISIGTTEEFVAAFNGSAEKTTYNINLTADIDLSSVTFTAGAVKMAGDYTGTFNGNGHKIYGYSVPSDASIWNNIGAAGVIENTVFEATVTNSAARPISYMNLGTIKNCSAILTIGGAINSVGAFAYAASSGSFINDVTSYLYDGSHDGNTFAALSFNGVSGTVKDCYYSLPETYLAGGFKDNGATALTKGAKGGIIAVDSSNITLGSSVSIEGMPYGSSYDSVAWTQSGAGAVTIDSGVGTNVITVKGSTAGSVTLTATYTKGTTSFTAEKAFTVAASTPVSAVSLSASSTSIYAGKIATITATLTGSEYDHIEWATSSSAIATVAASDLTATVTGVAQGNATISVTIYDASSSVLATADIAITVNPSVYVDIYLLESKNTEGKTSFWDTAVIWPYGEIGDNSKAYSMSKVTENGNSVYFRLANPTNSNTIDTYQLWKCSLDISGMTIGWTNAWIQYGHTSSDRWGAGFQITSANGNIGMLGYKGDVNPADSGWTTANLSSALTHSASTIYSGSWRDSSSSICYLTTTANATKLKTYYDSYAALTSGAKTIADAFDDSTTAYNSTYGETMAMLYGYYPSGSGSNAVQSTENNNNAVLVAALVGMGALTLAAGAFIFAHKKKQH
jgi:hypothetical protein